MVKDAESRKRKYEAKVDPVTLAKQTEALKPGMVSAEAQYFSNIAGLEYGVKRLVEATGATPLTVRDYLNFAREMYGLKQKFSGSTLQQEAQIRVDKWAARGLSGPLLVSIAELQGVDPEEPAGPSGTVDVSDRVGRLLGLVANLLNPHPVTVSNFPSSFEVSNFPAAFEVSNLPAGFELLDGSNVLSLVKEAMNYDAAKYGPILFGRSNETPNKYHQILVDSDGHLTVHLRNTSNVEINPATEDTLATLFKASQNIGNTSFAATQSTRASLLAKPEREDIVSLGGVASPNNNGAQLVAGSGSTVIKVFDAEYEAVTAGLHYFYFGTSTASTTKRFLSRQTVGVNSKTFAHSPRVGAAGDGLYLFSAVSDANIPYDVGYVQE